MVENFYDKVAKEFGRYHTEHKVFTEYPDKKPEDVFKEKLIDVSGQDKIALDVGCADGRFSLSMAGISPKLWLLIYRRECLERQKDFKKKAE
jgi:tRNA G46 methylase TrmB